MVGVTRVCGGLGAVDVTRVATMARLAGGVVPRVEQADAVVYGSDPCVPREDPAGEAWVWSVGGPPRPGRGSWPQAARDHDACGLVIGTDGALTVHGSISGAQPLYVELTDDAVYFATCLGWLVDSTTQPRHADWQAWAAVLGMGAPLDGRTTFEGVTRLGPMEYVEVRDNRPSKGAQRWPWLDIEPEPATDPEDLTGDVLDALRAQIRPLMSGPAHPLLSGGRDSRLIVALVRDLAGPDAPVTAWTTSSDTGTSMEELVAARVAGTLGLKHVLAVPRHDRFAADFETYAHAVDHQSSFHAWLIPIAQRLATADGTAMDGLGGGVFLGGGFADDPSGSPARLLDARFRRVTRYLEAGATVLGAGVGRQVRERIRADFDRVSGPLVDHPAGATFTAYLTRTMPGISLAPAKVLAGSLPTAMPIMTDQVISTALRLPNERKVDGAWYPDLLRSADPALDGMPTAADLTKRRQHVRRGASRQAAEWYRSLLLASPAGDLLSDEVRAGDAGTWAAQLTKTRPQHLIRGLAMLALWLDGNQGRLADSGVDALRDSRPSMQGATR